LKVCPFCDCLYHKGTISIEHYLPKSIYPFLAVHPINLIPCCEDCNGTKRDIDPLTNGEVGQTPFPYSFKFDNLANVVFDYENSEFIFISAGNDEEKYREFIRIMRDGYQLPKRWNNNSFLAQIIDMTFMNIAEKIKVARDYGFDPSNNIEEFLNSILTDFTSYLGKFDKIRLQYAWLAAAIKNDPKTTIEGIFKWVNME